MGLQCFPFLLRCCHFIFQIMEIIETYENLKITWWALYAKCTPWSKSDCWLLSLSEFRMDSSSNVTLFMYILAKFIDAFFICENFQIKTQKAIIRIQDGHCCRIKWQMWRIFFYFSNFFGYWVSVEIGITASKFSTF